jgi:hypothetical protein
MRNHNKIEAGVFYPIDDGHVLAVKDLPPGELERGEKFETNSMLSMWDLVRGGESVGWFFYSAFKVECKGGYLVTFMESRRGKAEESKLIVRRPEFVMFDVPRCGTLAVSMKVSPAMENILMEQ